MKKITILLMALSFFLNACSLPTTKGYENILDTWLGGTEDNLISKWGVPSHVYESGTKKYLTYYKSRSFYTPGVAPYYQTTYYQWTGTAYTSEYGGSAGYKVNYYCETTFTVVNGVITDWRWQGNSCRAQEE